MGPIQKRTLDRMIVLVLVLTVLVAVLLAAVVIAYFRGRGLLPSGVTQAQSTPVVMGEEQPEGEPRLLQVCEGELQRQDGGTVRLEKLRGEPVMLLFWSSWCSDCKSFLRDDLADVFAAARDAGVQAYLVCREGRQGEDWDSAEQCLQALGVTEPTLMDMGCAVYDQIRPGAVPSIVLLDREGRTAASTTHMPGDGELAALLELAEDGPQRQSERFLREGLLLDDGAIASDYGVQDGQIAPGNDVLSETEGLMMLYAVKADDRQLFDQVYGYVQNAMTVNGLAAWKVTGQKPEGVNATLDDLRVLEALLLAQEAWGGYAGELSFRADALFRGAVEDGILRDYADLETGDAGESVTLCYLDVDTLERLAQTSAKWEPVAEKAREILTGGVISERFPLYYPRYDPKSGGYEGDRLQMNEALVTIYHAAKAGVDCSAALDWLQASMEKDAVYAAYTTDGIPATGYMYESSATYALLAQTALLCGREDLALDALARVESARCFTPPLAGDLGLVTDRQHYTFDIVQTLLAWQQWNGRAGAR